MSCQRSQETSRIRRNQRGCYLFVSFLICSIPFLISKLKMEISCYPWEMTQQTLPIHWHRLLSDLEVRGIDGLHLKIFLEINIPAIEYNWDQEMPHSISRGSSISQINFDINQLANKMKAKMGGVPGTCSCVLISSSEWSDVEIQDVSLLFYRKRSSGLAHERTSIEWKVFGFHDNTEC